MMMPMDEEEKKKKNYKDGKIEYYSSSNGPLCCSHFPKDLGRHHIGVCPFCLTDRLLLLTQSRFHHHRRPKFSNTLGFLLRTFEFRRKQRRSDISPDHHHHYHDYDDDDDVDSPEEDSFISIKFNDNGVGLWEEKKVSKISPPEQYSCSIMKISSSSSSSKKKDTSSHHVVVEHGKASAPLLMWRKRIGHVFQLSRWRRSNNVTMCHVGREGVVKVARKKRSGYWIRNLMVKRRNNMESNQKGVV